MSSSVWNTLLQTGKQNLAFGKDAFGFLEELCFPRIWCFLLFGEWEEETTWIKEQFLMEERKE